MNILDSVIEAISPQRALKRQEARIKLKLSQDFLNSGYDESGASRSKTSMKGFFGNSKSPQEDIDMNLDTLRKRSRSLYMNNSPLARSAINQQSTNVIGPGLVLKPKINYKAIGISKEEAEETESRIKTEFSLWAESKHCDSLKLNNFYELQQIAFISWLLNGDAFILPVYDKETSYMPYSLRLHGIESDRVCTPESTPDYVNIYAKADNGNRIINGVEINKDGSVEAYYIADQYPYDYYTSEQNKWKRVKAFGEKTGNPNIIHIFNAERMEQYRGVPFLAPVIESLKQITRYTEAELMAAVINGLFAVFITTQNGGDDVDFAGLDEGFGEVEKKEENELSLGNGVINALGPGEGVEVVDAKRPNVNFDTFVSSMAKYIGAALGMPYEVLIMHFSSSYSASRAALLEAWKGFRKYRKWFTDDFCRPVYELWLAEAVAKERIHAPGFFLDAGIRKAYCGAAWNGPAPGQLDPVREAMGAGYRVEYGFSTREREAVEINGSDFYSNIDEQQREMERMKELGIWKEEKNA